MVSINAEPLGLELCAKLRKHWKTSKWVHIGFWFPCHGKDFQKAMTGAEEFSSISALPDNYSILYAEKKGTYVRKYPRVQKPLQH